MLEAIMDFLVELFTDLVGDRYERRVKRRRMTRRSRTAPPRRNGDSTPPPS
jgi:hypothetical protein